MILKGGEYTAFILAACIESTTSPRQAKYILFCCKSDIKFIPQAAVRHARGSWIKCMTCGLMFVEIILTYNIRDKYLATNIPAIVEFSSTIAVVQFSLLLWQQ